MGRSPCLRRRARCARTLSRDDFARETADLDDDAERLFFGLAGTVRREVPMTGYM